MDFGYLRVSTGGQCPEHQLDGMALDRRFADTISGHVRDRPELTALLDQVRPGDTIHVHSFDRLAWSLSHLRELVETITGRGVTLVFHREGLSFEGAMGAALQRMRLQLLLGTVAESDRSLSAARAATGRAATGRAVGKARGVRFGRLAVLTPVQVRQARVERVVGKSAAAIALDLDRNRPIIYRALVDGARGDRPA